MRAVVGLFVFLFFFLPSRLAGSLPVAAAIDDIQGFGGIT